MNSAVRPTVAIVEGDEQMSYLLSEICRTAGYEVTGRAATAGPAIELINQRCPDCLILDFGLGGRRNGLELLIEARGIRPDIFSILVTAWDINDIAARIDLDVARPDRILRKPVHPRVLIELLEKTAAARRQMSENKLPGRGASSGEGS